jgi:DNA-binding NarL/FixJ family response regulator
VTEVGGQERISVVLGYVDPAMRRALAETFAGQPSVRVVNSNADELSGESARVVILDESSEYPLILQLKSSSWSPAILVALRSPSVLCRSLLLAAGATCFHYGAAADEVVAAVQRAARGQDRAAHRPDAHISKGLPDAFDLLTEREQEVLTHLSADVPYARIALIMNLAEPTVKTHSRNIRRKLGVKKRKALVGIHAPEGAR